MKRILKLIWHEGSRRWHLLNPDCDDSAIMDFPDCENFRVLCDNPRKDKEDLYIVDIKRLENQ